MRLTQMETGSIDQHQNEAPVLSSTVSLIQDLKIAEHEKESPVSLLYKATQLQFKISPSWMGFTAEVEIDGEKFRGHGRSKKLSKANAARAALTKRFNIQFFKNTGKVICHFNANQERETHTKHYESFFKISELSSNILFKFNGG